MNTDSIIDGILKREGAPTNDPLDSGGRTAYGIAEKANPEAWADNKVTEEEARAIYFAKYFRGPGYDKLPEGPLQHLMVDFGVNSGPTIATKSLQEALGVKQDGVLGPKTLEVVENMDLRTLNNKVVAARVKLLCKICVKNPSQLKFLSGWVNRALEFLI